MIKAIKFASIPTRDQDAALEFWTTRVGFQVATDQPFDDTQRWIELGIGRNGAGIALFTPPEHKDRIGTFTGISLVADDVKATCKELKARGVVFAQEPTDADWGTFAMFKDPDGNTFVLGSG